MTDAPISDLDSEIATLEARKVKLIKLAKLRSEVALLESERGLSSDETVKRVLSLVAVHRRMTPDVLLSPDRRQPVVEARFIAVSLIRKYTRLSFSGIGKIFHRDHGTMIYAMERAGEMMETDKVFKRDVELLEAQLQKGDEAVASSANRQRAER